MHFITRKLWFLNFNWFSYQNASWHFRAALYRLLLKKWDGITYDTPPITVAQFVALRREGLSQRAIARRFEVSQSVVQRCLARHGATGSFNARKRPNRKRVASLRTDTMIRRIVKKNPTVSSTEISSALTVKNYCDLRKKAKILFICFLA